MNKTVEYLTSIHVAWEGTEAGFTPILGGDNPEAILKLEKNAIRGLIDALCDEALFVCAHVLLTQISGIEYEAFPTWNGLIVEMASDGTVTIDAKQRHDLAARWGRWYATEPRPQVLPPGN